MRAHCLFAVESVGAAQALGRQSKQCRGWLLVLLQVNHVTESDAREESLRRGIGITNLVESVTHARRQTLQLLLHNVCGRLDESLRLRQRQQKIRGLSMNVGSMMSAASPPLRYIRRGDPYLEASAVAIATVPLIITRAIIQNSSKCTDSLVSIHLTLQDSPSGRSLVQQVQQVRVQQLRAEIRLHHLTLSVSQCDDR